MIGSKFLLAATLAAAVVASGVASAQGNLKIGVINVGRLLEQAPQSQAVNAKLQDEFAPRQRNIVAMRQKLQTQQETFQRDAPVMGEAERLDLERQIRDGQRE
jgi:outer membrane protein